jgi:hypothetical protein
VLFKYRLFEKKKKKGGDRRASTSGFLFFCFGDTNEDYCSYDTKHTSVLAVALLCQNVVPFSKGTFYIEADKNRFIVCGMKYILIIAVKSHAAPYTHQ